MFSLAASEVPGYLPYAVIGIFLILFPAFWIGTLHLLSRIGGWHRLSADYTYSGTVPRPQFSWVSALIGWVGYNNILRLHLSDQGIHVSVPAPFKFGHPPLFIPWSEVKSRTSRRVLWSKLERLSIGSPPVATISLPESILAAWPAASQPTL